MSGCISVVLWPHFVVVGIFVVVSRQLGIGLRVDYLNHHICHNRGGGTCRKRKADEPRRSNGSSQMRLPLPTCLCHLFWPRAGNNCRQHMANYKKSFSFNLVYS